MPSSWLGIVPTNQVKPAKPLILRHLQHSATVGAGFIPVLPTADEMQNIYYTAARKNIQYV